MTEIEGCSWDIYNSLSVSTSVLYPLAPLGVGTPLVESLTSYLKRLAQAHHLKVADLVMFCSTQTDTHVLPSTLQKLSRIDGMTASAQAWSALLHDLTGREEVICLTMNYWRALLNPSRILRQHHAWCPLCFAQAARHETQPYELLLWRLCGVEGCPVHQCKLAEKCPNCASQLTTLSYRAVVGYCPKCQHWLGGGVSTNETYSLDTETSKRASAMGQLLSLAPDANPPRWNSMAQVIPLLKQRHRTTYTNLEKVLRIGTTTLSTLLAGQRQPSLDVFARLAVFSGEAFWEALTQPTCDTTHIQPELPNDGDEQQLYFEQLLASPSRLRSLSNIAQACGFTTLAALRQAFPAYYDALWQRIHEEQRLALEQALQQSVPVVLSKWAEQHGYRTNDLYHYFYDLRRQVTRRFQVDKEGRCRCYLEAVLQSQMFPTFTEICKTLGVGDYYLKQHFAVELQSIEAQRRHQLEQTEVSVHAYLNRILAADDASVSLEQIADTVGKSTRYLKSTFPTCSQAILRRRRAYLAQHLQTTCDRIRQTVFDLHQQGIYPSVDRIHAVIGSWMIHGKAYRRAYIEAMTLCGYLTPSAQ